MPLAWFALLLLLVPQAGCAAPKFPRLEGRVVDSAGLLSRQTISEVNASLAAHEQATTNQVVVVTVPDLGGDSIEEYGYQLGRHWGIGQKDKDNGALLIVAKSERKVRIEVGYGLEGELTDAVASHIIGQVITPRFKRGDFDGGVSEGVAAMLLAIGGGYDMKKVSRQFPIPAAWIPFVGFAILAMFILPALLGRRRMWPWLLIALANSSSSRGRGGGFGRGGGGGFRGGGGSFGGGGASGGW